MSSNQINNEKLKNYKFLEGMYDDSCFPDFLVDKGKQLLVELCMAIETQKPQDLNALYVITHATTEQFNELAEEFYENDSEIETAARECIALDFEFIAKTYGYENADIEELIATREW